MPDQPEASVLPDTWILHRVPLANLPALRERWHSIAHPAAHCGLEWLQTDQAAAQQNRKESRGLRALLGLALRHTGFR